MAVLAIFVFGFSMNIVSLNQPFIAPEFYPKKKAKTEFLQNFGEGKLLTLHSVKIIS